MNVWRAARRTVPMAAAMALACTAAAWAQTPAGPEFRVNNYTAGDQVHARPAMEPDGDFVVVWRSYAQDGSGPGIFGQRFAASGAARGNDFQINTYTTGAQDRPVAAVGSAGDFVVVWESDQDGSVASVHGRRFDAAGTAVGGEFLVNSYTPGAQTGPQVGRAADGRFVVLWETDDGAFRGIAARRFDASGNPVGAEFVVNTFTTGQQIYGALAVQADGSFVAAWQDNSNRDGSGSSVFGQRFDNVGIPLGSDFQVNTYTTGTQRFPSISVSPVGGFVVTWSGPGDGSGTAMFARRFDAAGNPIGNDFVVNTYTPGYQYGTFGQVAHDARGNFVVTWNGPGDGGAYGGTFGQRFNASGAARGAEFPVNTFTPGTQNAPAVASDAAGNFAVTWCSQGQDGQFGGIYAQRYGGLAPAALAVDSTGNQVLEPGETVAFRPSWRNQNGVAQTFGGALSSMTGPAGATYAVTDAAADYGTVANGASAQCTDCYAVSVSNPVARPVTHWDASAVESILPDSQGQQKQWRLHVGRSFSDVPITSPFYRFIETLLHHGVTSGCSATQYCPGTATTREQMAVFVLVAKEGTGYLPPACTTPVFNDVPASSPFCRWIEELARRAVVGGCGGGNYCPANAVTREQMAVFVLRTLDPTLAPPACITPIYGDVPASSPFCKWIEELTRRAVVSGCGGGNYCPSAPVTREQMGVFLGVTFTLTLYGS